MHYFNANIWANQSCRTLKIAVYGWEDNWLQRNTST